MNTRQILSLGIALFAMFFGAGNIIFPLELGRIMGDRVLFGAPGIFLSAVIMPLVGIIAGVLFEGDYEAFFARIGRIPGFLLAFICMVLVGPLGAIPRAITVSHGAVSWYFPVIKLWLFTIVSGVVIYFFTIHRNKVVDVIGRILGPLKIVLIVTIIGAGFIVSPSMPHTDIGLVEGFAAGLREGYMTLDLLAAIFFAKLIMVGVGGDSSRSMITDLVKASMIGALLLGSVYVGFMLIAAFHGTVVPAVEAKDLVFALSDYLLGRLGFISSATVAVACLVTAIALTAVFADYLSAVLFKNVVSYKVGIALTVFVTSAFANLGFSGIMSAIAPVVVICYPAMIVLAVFNIAYKLWGVESVKLPVYATLAATIARYVGMF